MSRSGYYTETDDALELGRWRGMVASASSGKRGQAFFRDLLAALDAMPDKRLIAKALQDGEGGVCAMGSLGAARSVNMRDIDPQDPEKVGAAFNIAPCLAQEVAFMNDEWGDSSETDEARWMRMRAWVAKKIKEAKK